MGNRRGSSKAGRPRDPDRERYDSGRVKPGVGAHATVLQRRKELIGEADIDLSSASDPLDFAHAMGFLSTARLKTALSYEALHQRAKVGGPKVGTGAMHETSPTVEVRAGAFSTLPYAEIVQIWNSVFNVTGGASEGADAKSWERWKEVEGALTGEERSELHATVINRSWPQWVILRARGKDVPPGWDRKRLFLESGLDKVRKVLQPAARPVTPRPPKERPAPHDYQPGDEAFFIEDGRRKRVAILSERTDDMGEPTRVVAFLDSDDGEFEVKERLLEPAPPRAA